MAKIDNTKAAFVIAVIIAVALGVRAPTMITRIPSSPSTVTPIVLLSLGVLAIVTYYRWRKK